MVLDGVFELLDIFSSPFPEGSLCLPVPLFPLLRRGIYLSENVSHLSLCQLLDSMYWLSSAFPLLYLNHILRNGSDISFWSRHR